jgi:hypothetical protein
MKARGSSIGKYSRNNVFVNIPKIGYKTKF